LTEFQISLTGVLTNKFAMTCSLPSLYITLWNSQNGKL